MNNIEIIRKEVVEHFNKENLIPGTEEIFVSPDGKYRAETRMFRQTKPGCNWEVTEVEIFETQNSTRLFTFFVNYGTFFHSWVKKDDIDYLICAEDLYGGQTIIDLSNKKMSSYSPKTDGYIWTTHILSPDKTLLAVFGCIWGSPYFTIIYHFEDPMLLPLKIAYEPDWTGYGVIEWLDNKSLLVKDTAEIESVLHLK